MTLSGGLRDVLCDKMSSIHKVLLLQMECAGYLQDWWIRELNQPLCSWNTILPLKNGWQTTAIQIEWLADIFLEMSKWAHHFQKNWQYLLPIIIFELSKNLSFWKICVCHCEVDSSQNFNTFLMWLVVTLMNMMVLIL